MKIGKKIFNPISIRRERFHQSRKPQGICISDRTHFVLCSYSEKNLQQLGLFISIHCVDWFLLESKLLCICIISLCAKEGSVQVIAATKYQKVFNKSLQFQQFIRNVWGAKYSKLMFSSLSLLPYGCQTEQYCDHSFFKIISTLDRKW